MCSYTRADGGAASLAFGAGAARRSRIRIARGQREGALLEAVHALGDVLYM